MLHLALSSESVFFTVIHALMMKATIFDPISKIQIKSYFSILKNETTAQILNNSNLSNTFDETIFIHSL